MAAPLDVLTRPTKFVKGGGSFIVVGEGPDSYLVTTKGAAKKLTLPASSYGAIENGRGGSCHEKVCVITGIVNGADGFMKVIFYASTNGLNWSVVHVIDDAEAECNGAPLVWSNDAFHASFVVYSGEPGLATAIEYETSSANGTSWSGRASVATVPFPEESGYRSPFPGSHCGHHDCIDIWSQRVPDGFMHKSETLTVAPKNPVPMAYSEGAIRFDTAAFSPSAQIVVSDGAGPPRETTASIAEVYCVAVSGSAWLAGGNNGSFGDVCLSQDKGMSWETVGLNLGNVVTAIVAVPFSGK